MGATLRKLDDEPILIVAHEGTLTLEGVEDVTARVVEAMQEAGTPLYGIIDLRNATTDLAEALRIVAHQSTGAMGTLSNRDSYVVLVGSHVLIRLFQKLMRERKFGGVTLSVYNRMDEALAAVRERIGRDAQQSA